MLLSLIVSSRFRVGVVGTGGRDEVEGIAAKGVDFTCPSSITREEEDGGDAVKGIGSGLCLSVEMGFVFGVEVII